MCYEGRLETVRACSKLLENSTTALATISGQTYAAKVISSRLVRPEYLLMVPKNDADSATAVDDDIALMLDAMQQTWNLPNIRELFSEPLLPPRREEEPDNWPHDVVIHLHELAQLNVDVDTVRQQLQKAVSRRRKARKTGPLAARFVIAADVQDVLRVYDVPSGVVGRSFDGAADSDGETDELNDLDTRTRASAADGRRTRED